MASTAIDLLIGKLASSFENELSLVGGAREQVGEIKSELESMKAFLKDAESRGIQGEVEKTWVAQVRDIAEEVKDIVDEFTYYMCRQQTFSLLKRTIHAPLHLRMTRRIAKDLEGINKRIRDIPERNQRYNLSRPEGATSQTNSAKNLGESALFMKDEELIGIEDAKHKLLGWLIDSPVLQRTVISVVGMGGSGKTSLVANVFNNAATKRHFEHLAWITVSQTYTTEDLLRVMVKELYKASKKDIPSDFNELSFRELVEIIVGHLTSQRYLVVLDDVWDVNLWRQINVALPDGLHRSRVMLTTRIEDVASLSFGVESHVHHVQPLTESQAWDLFRKKAFSSRPMKGCPLELDSIARGLVQKCKGLPLGIVALGALMSTKYLESEWRNVYNSLNWELSNNPMLDFVKSILLLSFNDLSYQLKHCFLYCCIFPEDYSMQVDRLHRLWIAEGFVEQVGGLTLEERAESYMMELIRRSMLQVVEKETDGRPKLCKMHDLLLELALAVSKSNNFCNVLTGQEKIERSRARRLSLRVVNEEIPQACKELSKVGAFFVFLPEMVSSSLYKLPSGFKMLKVLDLKDVPIVELPNEVGYCFNLKYLNLKRTKVKELPKFIGNLCNLQTLDIRETEIKVLPPEISNLKSLRHLFMYRKVSWFTFAFEYFFGTKLASNICELKDLQVLEAVEVGDSFIKKLRYMTQLTRLGLTKVREADGQDLCLSIEKMKQLYDLLLIAADENEILCMDALLSVPPPLKQLILGGRLEKVPCWIPSLENLKVLILHYSQLIEDPLPHIQGLPNLIQLSLRNAYTGNKLQFLSGFQKLLVLQLASFLLVNEIIIEKGVMPQIQKLHIHKCRELKVLPRGIEHLSCLQELDLIGIATELVELLLENGSMDRHKIQHISDVTFATEAGLDYFLENPS